MVRPLAAALLVAAGLVLLAAIARADFVHPTPGEIAVRDVPGTDRAWQEARAVIEAPQPAVYRWLTDFPSWPSLFHDVVSVEVLSAQSDAARVRMRSRIIGRAITVDVRLAPGLISYSGAEGSIRSAGRIFVTALGGGRTDVVMQSTAHVGGWLGVFATDEMVRTRQRAKLAADLADLQRLAGRAR